MRFRSLPLRRLPLPALALLAVAACVPEPAPFPPLPDSPLPARCGAPDLQHLVGQHRSVLATMKFAGPVRVIEPGMAVTMDFRDDRLNFLLDEAGLIESVSCG